MYQPAISKRAAQVIEEKKLEKRTQTKPKFTVFYVISVIVLDIVSKLSIISFDKETIISYRNCFDNSITITIKR